MYGLGGKLGGGRGRRVFETHLEKWMDLGTWVPGTLTKQTSLSPTFKMEGESSTTIGEQEQRVPVDVFVFQQTIQIRVLQGVNEEPFVKVRGG